MDRRSFLRRRDRPGGDPPLEALPGQRVPDDVAARWRAPRNVASAEERRAAQRGTDGEPLGLKTGLAPYVPTADAPWDRARARHLIRRTGFGARPAATDLALAMSPGDAVDALLDGAMALPPLDVPPWIDDAPPHWTAPQAERDAYRDANQQRITDTYSQAVDQMLSRGAADEWSAACIGLRERMALMWHSHVVTELDTYFLGPLLNRYATLLRRNAFGNVRTLVDEVGRDPAMLIYLNGVENRAGNPNENYARELFELFTMGIDGPDGSANYTQLDVTEAARALTGWGIDYYGETDTPLESLFVPQWFDDGAKTIFGQTGDWGYDDVVRLVFEQRGPETAHFVCRRLYRTFVHHVPDETVVAAMAAVMVDAQYEVAPVLRALLKSEHFFDAGLRGAAIKAPLEMQVGLWRQVGIDPDVEAEEDPDFWGSLYWAAHLAGQRLYYPPNVAGWPGGRTWVDTSRLTLRWSVVSWVVWRQDVYRAMLIPYPPEIRYQVRPVARAIADDWLGLPASDAQVEEVVARLLNGQDEQYWNPDDPSAENRIRGAVRYLTELPEFQLT